MNRKLRTFGLIAYSVTCIAIFILPVILLQFNSIKGSMNNSITEFFILYVIGLFLMLFSVFLLCKVHIKINDEENIRKQYIKKEKEFQAEFDMLVCRKQKYLELKKIKHDINNIFQSVETLSHSGSILSKKQMNKLIDDLQQQLDALNKINEMESTDV